MNTLFDLDSMSFDDMFKSLDGIEGNVVVNTPKTLPVTLFNSNDLYNITAKIMGISATDWRGYVVNRNMKPVKAAIKCGAKPGIAELVADLKLATTPRGIDEVYADTRCKSCMTGYRVGTFWFMNKVGVIYSPNFRLLVGLESKGLNPCSYGYKGSKVSELLRPFFNVNESPVVSKYEWESKTVYVGMDSVIATEYCLWTIDSDDISLVDYPDMLEILVKKGIEERKRSTTTMIFSRWSDHELPKPFNGTYKLKQRYCKGPSTEDTSFLDKLPGHFMAFEDTLGSHTVYYNQLLIISNYTSDRPRFEVRDVVVKTPLIKYSKDLEGDEVPFIDFDSEILSEIEANQKIIELGLVLNQYNTEMIEDNDVLRARPLNLSDMSSLRQLSLDLVEVDDIPF